jgi:hypothetical protein
MFISKNRIYVNQLVIQQSDNSAIDLNQNKIVKVADCVD